MASFGSLVLLKLHVQDCTGNRRAISGLVREGITLLEGIMNVVKQHGGNCNVEFNAQMAKHYLKEVEIGGLRLRDWIQFYSIRGAGVESETAEMCFRVLRSSDVFWENLTSQVLSGSQEFSFLLRDDVGMTADIPNPVNLLDADSVRRLNAVSFDGISPSLHVTSSVPGAIFLLRMMRAIFNRMLIYGTKMFIRAYPCNLNLLAGVAVLTETVWMPSSSSKKNPNNFT